MSEPRGQAPLAFRDIIRVRRNFFFAPWVQSVLCWDISDFLSVFASQNWQIGHHDFLYLSGPRSVPFLVTDTPPKEV